MIPPLLGGFTLDGFTPPRLQCGTTFHSRRLTGEARGLTGSAATHTTGRDQRRPDRTGEKP
ncbi:hypothetical protein [Amycolatopsis sp. NPDC051903]|uniref:hypothetical protein n=1 Tax=Amycolatopsis sp. NPDC051903 TaxID=3363936 RepID=UPI0037B93989